MAGFHPAIIKAVLPELVPALQRPGWRRIPGMVGERSERVGGGGPSLDRGFGIPGFGSHVVERSGGDSHPQCPVERAIS